MLCIFIIGALVMAALIAAPVMTSVILSAGVIGVVAMLVVDEYMWRVPRTHEARLDALAVAREAQRFAHEMGRLAHSVGNAGKEEDAEVAEERAAIASDVIEHGLAADTVKITDEQAKEW